MTILHGDARFYNNIFVQQEVRKDLTAYSESIGKSTLDGIQFLCGTKPYDGYPTAEEYFSRFGYGAAEDRGNRIFITIIFRSIRAGTYILTVLSPATRRKTIRWIPSIRFSLSLGKMGKAGICRQTCTNICPDFETLNGEHRAFGGRPLSRSRNLNHRTVRRSCSTRIISEPDGSRLCRWQAPLPMAAGESSCKVVSEC